MELANRAQSEFSFESAQEDIANAMRFHAFNNVIVDDFFDALESQRRHVRGYHPFIIAIVESHLDGQQYRNLFGSHESRRGLAVVTTSDVADVIVPGDRMVAYFLYYLARYALTFCAPHMSNHEDTRACIFDRKVLKSDIMHSMRSRAFCDPCRGSLITGEGSLSAKQFSAIESILTLAGRIIRDGTERSGKPRVFIGSSTAGLTIANQLQEMLDDQLSPVVWNQGTVFNLGDSTLEALENAVLEYSAGIFAFTADDLRIRDGQVEAVARDNVIFELGLFVGKLGRRRALVVQPSSEAITLPSDLRGITTATYDLQERNLAAALGPAANRIRRSLSNLQRPRYDH